LIWFGLSRSRAEAVDWILRIAGAVFLALLAVAGLALFFGLLIGVGVSLGLLIAAALAVAIIGYLLWFGVAGLFGGREPPPPDRGER
jgi:hypothetical protein